MHARLLLKCILAYSQIAEFLLSTENYGTTGVRDSHLSFKVDALGGVFHFIRQVLATGSHSRCNSLPPRVLMHFLAVFSRFETRRIHSAMRLGARIGLDQVGLLLTNKPLTQRRH